jgi:organic radical activating enzyme
MNTQIPTKRIKSVGSSLVVHSIFHTIQGEGPFTGQPAVFVRLGGCNLQCPGCDTEYTQGSGQLTIREIFDEITKVSAGSRTDLVVITGGEPFRQNLTMLVDQLHFNNIRVQIETNGSLAPQGEFGIKPVIICSPKTSKLNPELLPLIDAYKYVVDHLDFNPEDGLPTRALGHRATPQLARPHEGFTGSIYIQPMDMDFVYKAMDKDCSSNVGQQHDHNKANLKLCIESAMKFNYTLQLQVHKIIDME